MPFSCFVVSGSLTGISSDSDFSERVATLIKDSPQNKKSCLASGQTQASGGDDVALDFRRSCSDRAAGGPHVGVLYPAL